MRSNPKALVAVLLLSALSSTHRNVEAQSPPLSVQLNAASFGPGSTMTVTARLAPQPNGTPVDAYVVVQLPDGQFLSLQLGGQLVPGLVPIARNFVPFDLEAPLVAYTFTGTEPVGSYRWFSALTQPITLSVLGGLSTVPFVVGQAPLPVTPLQVPSLGIALEHPQIWQPQAGAPTGVLNISNAPTLTAESDASLMNEALLQIQRWSGANPAQMSTDAWFNAFFAQGFASDLLERRSVVVDGRLSVQVETQELTRMRRVYVPDGTDIVEVSYSLRNPSHVIEYERIVASLDIIAAIGNDSHDGRLATPAAIDPVGAAEEKIGSAYGTGPGQFDCSKLMQYAFGQFGVTLPRTSASQAGAGEEVSGPPQRGDLLFFATESGSPNTITHVGIYDGNGNMIHAPRPGKTVERVSGVLSNPYWAAKFRKIRRVPLDETPVAPGVYTGQFTSSSSDGWGWSHTQTWQARLELRAAGQSVLSLQLHQVGTMPNNPYSPSTYDSACTVLLTRSANSLSGAHFGACEANMMVELRGSVGAGTFTGTFRWYNLFVAPWTHPGYGEDTGLVSVTLTRAQ